MKASKPGSSPVGEWVYNVVGIDLDLPRFGGHGVIRRTGSLMSW